MLLLTVDDGDWMNTMTRPVWTVQDQIRNETVTLNMGSWTGEVVPSNDQRTNLRVGTAPGQLWGLKASWLKPFT